MRVCGKVNSRWEAVKGNLLTLNEGHCEFAGNTGVEKREASRDFIVRRSSLILRTDALDRGAYGDELVFDALVAAVDVIDAVDPGGVVGDESGEHETRAG